MHWTEVVGPLLGQDHSLPLTNVSEKGAKEASGTWQASRRAPMIGVFFPFDSTQGSRHLERGFWKETVGLRGVWLGCMRKEPVGMVVIITTLTPSVLLYCHVMLDQSLNLAAPQIPHL